MTTMTDRLYTLKAWLKRNEEKGKLITADMLWVKIGDNWPLLDATQREELFQQSYIRHPRITINRR